MEFCCMMTDQIGCTEIIKIWFHFDYNCTGMKTFDRVIMGAEGTSIPLVIKIWFHFDYSFHPFWLNKQETWFYKEDFEGEKGKFFHTCDVFLSAG